VLTNLSTQTVLLEKNSIVALIETFELQKGDNLNTIVVNNLPFKVATDAPMDELNNEEQKWVGELLHKYGNLFVRKATNNIASNVVHQIDTGLSKPIHCP